MGEKKDKEARLLREWAEGAVERSEALFQASLEMERPGHTLSEGSFPQEWQLHRARIRADRAAVLAAGDVVAEAVDEMAEDIMATLPAAQDEDDVLAAIYRDRTKDRDLPEDEEDLPSAGADPFSLVTPPPA